MSFLTAPFSTAPAMASSSRKSSNELPKETTWSYDSLGNRLSEMVNIGTTESEAYEYYDNTNRVKSWHGWKYSYDANGNLVAKGTSGAWDETTKAYEYESGLGEVYEYRYDLLNRLLGVKHSESGTEGLTTIAIYGYDMRALRVSSTVKGTKTLRQYDLTGKLIWEDGEDLDRRYVIALGGIWAESEIEGGNERTYWHHVDHLGTSEAITDEEGEVVWEANYGVFGEVLMSNGSKSFEPSYTGKEWESAIGLYYFNARWYDPNLGRFITEDPARDGENWYGYCENNPLKYIDPDGRITVKQIVDVFSKMITATQQLGKSNNNNTNRSLYNQQFHTTRVEGYIKSAVLNTRK